MDDDPGEFERFLAGELDPETFRHRDHVRMAFIALEGRPFLEAATMVSTALRRMADRAGRPRVYHETVTLAYLALIAERRAASPTADFEAFAATNPDLFDRRLLLRWYSVERLDSAQARDTFLLPDRMEAGL